MGASGVTAVTVCSGEKKKEKRRADKTPCECLLEKCVCVCVRVCVVVGCGFFLEVGEDNSLHPRIPQGLGVSSQSTGCPTPVSETEAAMTGAQSQMILTHLRALQVRWTPLSDFKYAGVIACVFRLR